MKYTICEFEAVIVFDGSDDLHFYRYDCAEDRERLVADCQRNNAMSVCDEIINAWGPLPAPPSLDKLKAAKRDEIAAARHEAETGGCTVDGVTIATDRGSQALLTAAVVTARLDPEFKTRWKCADGRFVTLDAMQLRAIGDAVIAHVEACFAREAELCELVDAAETPEDVAAITWSI